MEYKVGQIFFWNNSDSLFGKIITLYNNKVFGRSDCVHCGIISEVEKDRVLIHEAGDNGFNSSWYKITWLDERIKDGKVKIKETIEPLTNVFNNCEKYVGIGYGWLDIITIAIGFLTGFKISLTDKNKIICSEAVSYVIYDSSKQVNIAAEYGLAPDQVTPMHIFLSQQLQ
jgi:hypothetical protein